MVIEIYNELILNVDERGNVFLDNDFQNKADPKEETEYWIRYDFLIQSRLVFMFKDLEALKSRYRLINLPPGTWEKDSSLLVENPYKKSVVKFSVEFCVSIQINVSIPFTLTWNTKKQLSEILGKVKLAQESFNLSNININPPAKFIKGKKDKENQLIIFKIKSPPKFGKLDGSIDFVYIPEHKEISTNWGHRLRHQNQSFVQKYTQLLPYWNSNEKLKKLISELDESLLAASYQIFNVVKSTITPMDSKIRKGSTTTLAEEYPQGDCDEFTDLIMALMRMYKIPCRRVNGLSYPDSYHTWPEVYVSTLGLWIPIDAALETFGYLKSSVIPINIDGTTSNTKLLEIVPFGNEFNLEILDPEINIERIV